MYEMLYKTNYKSNHLTNTSAIPRFFYSFSELHFTSQVIIYLQSLIGIVLPSGKNRFPV